jgi:hypothetical protein
LPTDRQLLSRLLKKVSDFVLSRVPPCDVPQGYASVVPLPAASSESLFEQASKENTRKGL